MRTMLIFILLLASNTALASTRASIVFKDKHTTLYFYRHTDGGPSITGEQLKKFVLNYTSGNYRLNVSQSAGHLILLGAASNLPKWKASLYEPDASIATDARYVYTIDLHTRSLTITDKTNTIIEQRNF